MLPLRDLVPVQRRPWVTYGLIALNVAVFAYEATLDSSAAHVISFRYGVVPYMLVRDFHLASVTTLFTSMFLHGDLLHLASNMWFLHIFGDNVEDALGRVKFILFYLAVGVCAALTHVLVDADSRIPMVGASGAIAGVLAAYTRLYPRARVVTLIPVLVIMLVRELPARFFIVAWFVLQLLYAFGSLGNTAQTGGIAFFAHIGGFGAGLLLLALLGAQHNATEGFASQPPPPQPFRAREPWEP